jgi:hypothetical protein
MNERKPVKLKVYHGNFDGTNVAIVAAPNQKEAARLLRCPLGYFRRYGGVTEHEDYVAIAMASPGVVFKREYSVTRKRGDRTGWVAT